MQIPGGTKISRRLLGNDEYCHQPLIHFLVNHRKPYLQGFFEKYVQSRRYFQSVAFLGRTYTDFKYYRKSYCDDHSGIINKFHDLVVVERSIRVREIASDGYYYKKKKLDKDKN